MPTFTETWLSDWEKCAAFGFVLLFFAALSCRWAYMGTAENLLILGALFIVFGFVPALISATLRFVPRWLAPPIRHRFDA